MRLLVSVTLEKREGACALFVQKTPDFFFFFYHFSNRRSQKEIWQKKCMSIARYCFDTTDEEGRKEYCLISANAPLSTIFAFQSSFPFLFLSLIETSPSTGIGLFFPCPSLQRCTFIVAVLTMSYSFIALTVRPKPPLAPYVPVRAKYVVATLLITCSAVHWPQTSAHCVRPNLIRSS